MEDFIQKKVDDIAEWQKRYCKDDITPEEVKDIYNEWAEGGYDEMMSSEIWRCPKLAADMLEKVHNSDGEKMCLRILDIGAGTGQCGMELKRKGFQHLDGLDQAENMLAKAKERNVYENYINTGMTDKDLDIDDGTYDVVIASGVGGFFCSKAVREMARIVKSESNGCKERYPEAVCGSRPDLSGENSNQQSTDIVSGGTIVIVSNYEQRAFHGNLQGTLKALENEKQIVLVQREVRDGYLHKQRADAMIYKVL